MLKLLKGLDQPLTIINTDRIKFAQCDEIGSYIRLFMSEGFSQGHTSYEAGIVLNVDYDINRYDSKIELMEEFLAFLNSSNYWTDEFGICPVELV